MASRSYSISFNVLGNLDPSLLSALKNASDRVKALSNLERTVNAKAVQQAKKLSAAQGKLSGIEQYKNLRREIAATNKARLQEIQNASKANAALQRQQKNLAAMKNSYKELQKVQTRLKGSAQVQKNGVDLARADLKNAKKSGDVNAIRSAQAALARQQESARRAAEEVKAINAALKQGKSELRAAQADIRNFGSSFAQSSDKARALSQQLAQQRAELANVQKNLSAQGISGNLGAQEVRLRSEIQSTTAALNQEIAALERRNQVFNNFSNAQRDMANAWSNFQNSVDTAKTLMTPFKDAAQNAETFEFAMSQVKALTSMQNIRDGKIKQVEEDMAALTAQAERLGATTEFTSTEIAHAMSRYGYAGWNAQQIRDVMNQTVDFSSVTGHHNIDRAADILSDDLTIMGVKAGEQVRLTTGKMVDAVSHFTDNYAYAITKANLDEEALHASLTYNAPAMQLAGLSQGEIFASNMIAANAGLKGSVSGTAFRTGWIRMLAPAKKGAKALEEIGLTATESQKQMAAASAEFEKMGVTETSTARERLMALKQAYDQNAALGEEGRSRNAQMLDAIIGKNAFSTWANLFKDNNLEQMLAWAEYMDSGMNEGWTQDTAAVMRDNTRTAIELFNSSMDALQRAAGQALLPALRSGAEFLSPIITSLSEFVAANPAFVQACAAIAASLAAATVAVAGFSLAMAGVRFAQAGWATASLVFGDLATKITALRTALAGLTLANVGAGLSAGLTAASTAARAFGAAMMTAARAALAFVFTPVGAVLTALAIAALWAAQNWERVGPAISTIGSIVTGILVPAFENAKNAISNLLDIDLGGFGEMISSIANGVGAGLVGAFIILGGTAATVVSSIIAALADLQTMLANVLNNVKEVISAFLDADFSKMGSALKSLVFDFGRDSKNIYDNFVSNMGKGFSLTDDAFTGFIRSGYNQPAAQETIQTAQEVNTQPIQMAVDTTGQALNQMTLPAQETGMSLSQVSMPAQELAATMPMVPPELNNMTMAAQMTSPELTNVGTSAQVASPSVDTLGTSSAGAGGMIQSLGGVAIGASVNIAALSGAASAVAGALQAKAAEIGSITIPQPQLQVVTLTQTVAASESNASGGIYSKGAFLTTFAEKSAEAAIPLNRSPRAISLWQQAGSMLGMFDNPINFPQLESPPINFPTFESPQPAPNFNVTIHVTIQGNANKDDVQQGIEQSIPTLRRTFEEEFYNWQHERARRSYA